MNGDVKGALPLEVERALRRSDALHNVLARFVDEYDDRQGLTELYGEAFVVDLEVLQEVALEADRDLERLKDEHGLS